MSKVGICMANGCEEIEALTVVDLLRRANVEIDMVSINDNLIVEGAHGITFQGDVIMDNVDWSQYDGIVLPGGMPGTINLENDARVQKALINAKDKNKLIGAICAAPSILGHAGLVDGKKVTSFPGFEDAFSNSEYLCENVVVDGNIITSRGMGTAIDFGLAIIAYYKGEEEAQKMAKTIQYK